MFCANCGAENAENNFRCVRCNDVLMRTDVGDGLGLGPAPSRLAWSIIVTILCCWAAGIPAIVFAAQTMGHNSAGRFEDAHRTSKQATTWCWVAFGVGLLVTVGYLGLVLAGGMASAYP